MDATALLRSNLYEVFGQRDETARREMAERIYASDVVFADDEGTVHGWAAVSDKAGALLGQVAPDFAFAEDSLVYAGAGRAALAWRFGPPDAEPVVRGIDVVTVVDGRISEMTTLIAS